MIIDIRSKEIADWRKKTRELAGTLAALEKTANANDKILLTLHKVALVLIAEPTGWADKVETLLIKNLNISACRLVIFSTPPPAKLVKTLGTKGTVSDKPISTELQIPNAKSYFYLPLKKHRLLLGVLVFADKKANAFPADAANDFALRLAEMISARLPICPNE